MQKRAIAVQDISCVGRCSLTVALPILSAAGINTAIVPTALLSSHTGEFTGYTYLDLSNQISPIAQHLHSLHLHFDAFYTGYLASGAQVNEILSMLTLLCNKKTHIFVDPAFADHGRMYPLMDASMPAQMRKLCARARTIVPNLTEAALLLDERYPENGADERCIANFCRRLCKLGPDNIVITDVAFDAGKTGIAIYNRAMSTPLFLMRNRFEGLFHGTGDVFASFLLGGLLKEQPIETAAARALDLTHQSIALLLESGEPLKYGVPFEQLLGKAFE